MPRIPYPPPQHSDGATSVTFPPRQIQFRHPGYDSPCDILFTVPGADKDGSLHHETARLACALIAGNRVDGFLTEDRDGQEGLPADTEFKLCREHYYFQVPKSGTTGLDKHYAVIPSFRHWSPESVPEYWKACTIDLEPPHPMPRASAFDVVARDISCRMTQYKESTEIAHLIPTSETDWFNSRAMWQYANIDGPGNAVLLRSDIHTLFDAKNFAIVPLRMDNTPRLVAYVFSRKSSEEVFKLYHNVVLQPLYGISLEILWARFAYTVFEGIKVFLESGMKRWLRIRGEDGAYEDRLCDTAECRSYAARPRSTSPQKRSRVGTSALGDDQQTSRKRRLDSLFSQDSSTVTESDGFPSPERGRKRRRTCSSPGLTTNNSELSPWLSMTDSTSVESSILDDGIPALKEQQETSSINNISGLRPDSSLLIRCQEEDKTVNN